MIPPGFWVQGAEMKRRTFVVGSAAFLAMPGIVRAQAKKPTKRLAMIRPAGSVSVMTPSTYYKPFFEELARQGYVEGQNLIVFRYSAEGHEGRYGVVVQQAIDAAPDVIWCASLLWAMIDKKTTITIPIVAIVGDPVAEGLTTSLVRQSSNITGVTVHGGYEIWGKRLSILKEAIEHLKRPWLLSKEYWWDGPTGQAVRQAAEQLGLSLAPAILTADVSADSYASIFEGIESSGADGILVDDSVENLTHRVTITSLAAKHRLPAIYPLREYVVDGGLLAYAVDLSEVFRIGAGQIASIFGGSKPVDIPFVQPTKYQLVANVKAAHAIGLTLPPSLLLRADEVIE
jgi:putative tryptophan/tyrosine transport system substrate-binding protein